MIFPTSIDISHSQTNFDFDGGWMEIYFHHTFPEIASTNGRGSSPNDQIRDDGPVAAELRNRNLASARPRLTPTQIRYAKCQASASFG